MDLRKQLLKDHSKENTSLIVDHLLEHHHEVPELMHIFLQESYRLIQRAAWVVGDLARSKPELISPYIPQMIQNLKKHGYCWPRKQRNRNVKSDFLNSPK